MEWLEESRTDNKRHWLVGKQDERFILNSCKTRGVAGNLAGSSGHSPAHSKRKVAHVLVRN